MASNCQQLVCFSWLSLWQENVWRSLQTFAMRPSKVDWLLPMFPVQAPGWITEAFQHKQKITASIKFEEVVTNTTIKARRLLYLDWACMFFFTVSYDVLHLKLGSCLFGLVHQKSPIHVTHAGLVIRLKVLCLHSALIYISTAKHQRLCHLFKIQAACSRLML